MRQEIIGSSTGTAPAGVRSPFWQRLIAPVACFIAACALDMLTGQRYSSIWGSIAIIASLIALFPALRPALAAIGTYGGVWLAFNLIRAVAEDVSLSVAGTGTVADLERQLFGGILPSTGLQERLFDINSIGVHYVVLSLVHGSFFIVPFLVAALAWRRRRPLFRRYALATAITFTLGCAGFVVLPTSPPWLAAPDAVTRVTHTILATSEYGNPQRSAAFSFEPNHLAAMPSVHVAATVLVFLMARHAGRMSSILGVLYAFLMSVAVVYLGEHYVLDAAAGWAAALVSWVLASRVLQREATEGHQNRSGTV